MSVMSAIRSAAKRVRENNDTAEARVLNAERQSATSNSIEHMHRVEALRQQGSYLVHDPMIR